MFDGKGNSIFDCIDNNIISNNNTYQNTASQSSKYNGHLIEYAHNRDLYWCGRGPETSIPIGAALCLSSQ